jgi:hypothetical protein
MNNSSLCYFKDENLKPNTKPMHMHAFNCPVYHSDVLNCFTVYVQPLEQLHYVCCSMHMMYY